jgi:hypothetical protein
LQIHKNIKSNILFTQTSQLSTDKRKYNPPQLQFEFSYKQQATETKYKKYGQARLDFVLAY